MPHFSAYQSLPSSEQLLHGIHFMLCSFAVLIACVPIFTVKGSPEHKFAGLVYLPVSLAALFLASFMAWRESSIVLFCFNCFCAYLLLSGWRAVHESAAPKVADWLIPSGLFLLASGVTLYALLYNSGLQSFYLLFFALNAFYLAWRDGEHLKRRRHWSRHQAFFADAPFGAPNATAWLGRHVAGMIGSMVANLSVVAMTVLPPDLQEAWPVALLLAGGFFAYQERSRKKRLQKALAPVLQGKFRPRAAPRKDGDFRKAA